MTISELYKQVAQLGFEDSLEDEDRFYYAANRALLQVNKIRPAISYYLINHKPLTNLVKESTFIPLEKDKDLIYEATNAKSYYFEADGNGVVYIELYDTVTETWKIIDTINLSSKRAFVPYKGFIKEGGEFVNGNVRLRFTGDYFYSIKNIAMYEHLFSDEVQDIPAFESYTRYDINTLVDDFLALSCPPIKEAERNLILNQDYEVEGNSVILLPYESKGVYKVLYERKPAVIEDTGDVTNDDNVIDLDDELCSLLPVLIAAYVWIDDEPQKSEYYMSLYRERSNDIEQRAKDATPVTIKSSNRW